MLGWLLAGGGGGMAEPGPALGNEPFLGERDLTPMHVVESASWAPVRRGGQEKSGVRRTRVE